MKIKTAIFVHSDMKRNARSLLVHINLPLSLLLHMHFFCSPRNAGPPTHTPVCMHYTRCAMISYLLHKMSGFGVLPLAASTTVCPTTKSKYSRCMEMASRGTLQWDATLEA